MTVYPEALLAHLAREVTTLCHCWRLTRRDDVVAGFTDHDRPLSIAGVSFEPQSGFAGSEARDSLGLAIDTVDVEGVISSAGIVEADIAAGLYDGATVETLLVNWRNPADHARIRRATIGTITRSDQRFTAELESLTHQLDRVNGRYFRRDCYAELGDARCGFDTGADGFSGSGAVVSLEVPLRLVVSGLDGFAAGWFTRGLLTWTSGVASGRTARVAGHRKVGGVVELALADRLLPEPAEGDGFTIVAGCDKSFATCRAKFANSLNFRGFPHLPGNDAAYGYVTDGGQFDGGPLVP